MTDYLNYKYPVAESEVLINACSVENSLSHVFSRSLAAHAPDPLREFVEDGGAG